MDGIVLAFVGAMAVALAIALGVAWSRGRTLEAIGDALHAAVGESAGPSDETLVDRVRRVRRRAEAAEFGMAQRLRDLAYLTDLVGVGMIRLTDDLRVEVANAAAHVYLHRDAGSMVGRTAIEALGDHRVEEIARAARDRGSAGGEVTTGPQDSGSTLVVRARRSPILGVWVVLEDVAELRRLQRIRAEFIDNLSHELRTPIATVGLLVEALVRDAELAGEALPQRMRARIGKLEVETGNIAQMVAELLDLARIEGGGRQQLHLDDVDLGAVAEESAERLRPFAERQGVTLSVDVERHVPPVRGEAARLGQVFANLIHNAVKFSPSAATVEIAVRQVGGAVEGSVRDHGVGIAPVDQARIFERFYKADRARTRGGGGTGLGLAIARHVVAGHGGEIRVESQEGLGSTFTFTIPVGAAGNDAGSGEGSDHG